MTPSDIRAALEAFHLETAGPHNDYQGKRALSVKDAQVIRQALRFTLAAMEVDTSIGVKGALASEGLDEVRPSVAVTIFKAMTTALFEQTKGE